MMRNISFALTTPQFIAGTKTVTRRMKWLKLKAGDRLMAVEKGMGLKPGEKVKRLGEIEIVSVRREPLSALLTEPGGCTAEGFPEWDSDPQMFIDFFCDANDCDATDEVTRIEFRKVEA